MGTDVERTTSAMAKLSVPLSWVSFSLFLIHDMT